MAHLLLLGFEVTGEEIMRLDFESHTFNYFQTCLAERLNLRRVVRHNAHRTQTEFEQDFSALLVASHVCREAETLVCFDCVCAFVLECVGANLVDDADATT